MSLRPRIGLLGGTFDPIHVGHLALARAATEALGLDRIRFIPAAQPPHRAETPGASEYHRVQMVGLAVADEPGWEVCDLELQRAGPSYTIDTLAALHAEGLNPLQMFFLTGSDAFAEIATWHRYPTFLDGAHFAVFARPGTTLEALRRRLPELADRMVTPSEVTAARPPRIILIEAALPDMSSTDIRARVARGESIETFVPPTVAAYIRDHDLYELQASRVEPRA